MLRDAAQRVLGYEEGNGIFQIRVLLRAEGGTRGRNWDTPGKTGIDTLHIIGWNLTNRRRCRSFLGDSLLPAHFRKKWKVLCKLLLT